MSKESLESNSLLFSFDIGTSSIGYCVFELGNDDNPKNLLHTGVRIFNDGRDPKRKEPLSVARRIARGIRRNRDRNKNRIRRLINELTEYQLLPQDKTQRDKVFTLCPYACRAKSAETEVSKAELSRALIHIAKNRGFKSNRLAGESEDSAFFSKINGLKEKLGDQTLGQFQYAKIQANETHLQQGNNKHLDAIRFNGLKNEFFPSREMLKQEFMVIKSQQEALLTTEQWAAIEETIFWQYPLKPVEKGKCRFFPNEQRANKSLPIAHEFRILQDINNLRYTSENQQFELDL